QALDIEGVQCGARDDQLEAVAAGRSADLGRVAVAGERDAEPVARVRAAVDGGVDAVADLPDDRVVAGAAVDGVGAWASRDGIGAAGAADRVVAVTAVQSVVAAAAVQLVVAGAAVERVVVAAGDHEQIVAGAAVERRPTRTEVDQRVVAVAAVHVGVGENIVVNLDIVRAGAGVGNQDAGDAA